MPWIYTHNGFYLCAYHYNRIKLLGPGGAYIRGDERVTKVRMFTEAEWREKNRGMRAEDV